MSAMKISVWDTYVAREDGKTMHFDILVSHNLKYLLPYGNGQRYHIGSHK